MSTTRIRQSLVAMSLALVALAGCSDGSANPPDAGSGASTDAGSGPSSEPTKPARIKAGDRYVALGDSYTAGPQLGRDSGKPGCRQTIGNYPHRLAKALRLDLVDVSCGSARLSNFGQGQSTSQGTVPPQFDAITKDTRLVTLGIGGNEGGLFGTVVVVCPRLGADQPGEQPCTDFLEQDATRLDGVFRKLATGVEDAIVEIRERAPGARVIVVGYPQIIPAKGTCAALPLAAGDYAAVRGLFTQVNAAVKKGADAAKAEYADLSAATAGHDICGKEPWIAGATVDPARAGSLFHPYIEEQQAVAAVLRKLLAL